MTLTLIQGDELQAQAESGHEAYGEADVQTRPLISVIIPMYNEEAVIDTCRQESILE